MFKTTFFSKQAPNMIKINVGFFAVLITVALIAEIPSSRAANDDNSKLAKIQEIQKSPLILMPLRISEGYESQRREMEVALAKSLQREYEIYSYEAFSVKEAPKEIDIIKNEKKAKTHTLNADCDETDKLQNMAESIQAEMIATLTVIINDDDYFFTLNIVNIADNTLVYSKAMPCKSCAALQVTERLKEFADTTVQGAIAAADNARRSKQNLERLEQVQQAFEQKLLDANFMERKRLLEIKAQDDDQQKKLQVSAEASKGSDDAQILKAFPTAQAAAVELLRLKAQVNAIETEYSKEIEPIGQQLNQRYAAKINELAKEKRTGDGPEEAFKEKQETRRIKLLCQRDALLGGLEVVSLAADETSLLRKTIKDLSATEYPLGMENMNVKLGEYDVELQRFPLSVSSKSPGVFLTMKAFIQLPIEDVLVFIRHWEAAQIRLEAKVKPGGNLYAVDLVNDANHSKWPLADGAFMSAATRDKLELSLKEKQKLEDTYRPAMVKIAPGKLLTTPVKAFWMGATEVTQSQWLAVMGTNPSYFQGDNLPVGNVSWSDIQEYIAKLNKITGKKYRLPTGSEWEYACYGGGITEFCGSNDIDEVAWYDENSNNLPHPVGMKHGNGYGLYDMSGNVAEWTNECWERDCVHIVLRGGSQFSQHQQARADKRIRANVSAREIEYGFRLAMTP